jgi:hypothetical protein
MLNLTVTTAADVVDETDGLVSLREAVAAANASDAAEITIGFAAGLNTVRLERGLLLPFDAAAGTLRISGDTDGDGVSDVTLTDGAGGFSGGYVLRNQSAERSVVIENIAFSGFTIDDYIDQPGQGVDGERPVSSGQGGGSGTDGRPGIGPSVLYNLADMALVRVEFAENVVGLAPDGGTEAGGGNASGGFAGAPGADGFNGRDGGDGRPGGSGGGGGTGGDGGATAGSILNYAGATLSLRDVVVGAGVSTRGLDGGDGGRGGDGARGGRGGDGSDASTFSHGAGDGGDGGRGGNGGAGGAGGAGGDAANGLVNLGSFTAATPLGLHAASAGTATAGTGGTGGAGGSRGEGGARGLGGDGAFGRSAGSNGSAGSPGTAGARGTDGAAGREAGAFLGRTGEALAHVNTLVYLIDRPVSVVEGETAAFTLVRGGNTDTTVSVRYELVSQDGFQRADLAAGALPFSGSVTFQANGPDVLRLAFATLRDGLNEGTETFELRLLGAETQGGRSETAGLGTARADATVLNENVPTPGNDIFTGSDRDEVIDLLAGNDVFAARGGNDLVAGGAGNDRLAGEAGDDTLNGGEGADTLDGGEGDDLIWGGLSPNDLRDVVFGLGGNDTIHGGAGNDDLNGGDGDDLIFGEAGADTVIGNAGNDTLNGGGLSDALFGGPGADVLNGGFGFDRLNGGAGADRFFHLGVRDHGSDWIQDFSAADGDSLLYGGTATAAQFQVNLARTPGAGAQGIDEAFVIHRPTGQILWALVDGGALTSITLQTGGQTFDLLA